LAWPFRSLKYADVYSMDIRRIEVESGKIIDFAGTPNGNRTRVTAVKGLRKNSMRLRGPQSPH
jgi:hypothetical protein